MAAVAGARSTGRWWAVGGFVVALLMGVVTYLLVIAPARADADDVRTQVDDAVASQQVLRNRLRDLETASGQLPALQAAVAAAEGAIPELPDTQSFLRALQASTTASGVGIDQVSIAGGEPTAGDGLWAIPLDLVLTGPLRGLVQVLGALQATTGRAFTVSASSLDIGTTGPPILTLTVQMYCTADPTGLIPATTDATGAGAAASGGGGAAAADGSVTTAS